MDMTAIKLRIDGQIRAVKMSTVRSLLLFKGHTCERYNLIEIVLPFSLLIKH